MSAVQESLTLDDTYHILSKSRRRSVIGALLVAGEKTTQSEIVDHVAASKEEVQKDGESDAEFRKRVYTGLRQTHLPKLDDYGVIDHDRDEGIVRKGPNFDAVVEQSFGVDLPGGEA